MTDLTGVRSFWPRSGRHLPACAPSPRAGRQRACASSCRIRPAGRPTSLPAPSASRCRKRCSQSVIVENKPGANGNLGADLVAKSPPDGYTLLLCDVGALAISPSVYTTPAVRPVEGFARRHHAGVFAAPAGGASVGAGIQSQGAGRAVEAEGLELRRVRDGQERRIWPASRWSAPAARAGSTCPTRAACRRSRTRSAGRRRS